MVASCFVTQSDHNNTVNVLTNSVSLCRCTNGSGLNGWGSWGRCVCRYQCRGLYSTLFRCMSGIYPNHGIHRNPLAPLDVGYSRERIAAVGFVAEGTVVAGVAAQGRVLPPLLSDNIQHRLAHQNIEMGIFFLSQSLVTLNNSSIHPNISLYHYSLLLSIQSVNRLMS